MEEIGCHFKLEKIIGNNYHNSNLMLSSGRNCLRFIIKERTIETAKIVYPYLEPVVLSYLTQRDLGELNKKLKKDYDSEYLKLVRNYIINPQGAESIHDIIKTENGKNVSCLKC